jgi:hypothetical protein
MREAGVERRRRQRFKTPTRNDHDQPVVASLLNRDVTAAVPNERWVGDTWAVLSGEGGKLSLVVMLGLDSRFVIGGGGERGQRSASDVESTRDGDHTPLSRGGFLALLESGLRVRERG